MQISLLCVRACATREGVYICMKLKKILPTHNSLKSYVSRSKQKSHTSFLLIFLTPHELTPLHKSHYSLTSAAAHRPIREADKTQGYMAKTKVKIFNSSLGSSALINKGIYKHIKGSKSRPLCIKINSDDASLENSLSL